MKKYFLVSIFCLLFFSLRAQDLPSFTEQQKLGFEKQVIGYVRDFCYYLGDLASTSTTSEDKPQLKKDILTLFVNSAKMEVVSVSHPQKPKAYPINKYLDIVGNYSGRYKFVALQFYKVVVDTRDLKETIINGQTAYVGTYSYWQRFLASNQEKESNQYTQEDFMKGGSDETKKTGYFYIIKKDTKSDRNGLWFVLLGDVKTKEIRHI